MREKDREAERVSSWGFHVSATCSGPKWYDLNWMYTHAHTRADTQRPHLRGHGVIGYPTGKCHLSAFVHWHTYCTDQCVFVCVLTWSVVGVFYTMWQKRWPICAATLSIQRNIPQVHSQSIEVIVCFGGFIALDGLLLTNNKLDNCELIKKKYYIYCT